MKYSKDELKAILNGTRPIQLKGADLSETFLNKADLEGADLSEANLWRADLSFANLKKRQLKVKRIFLQQE